MAPTPTRAVPEPGQAPLPATSVAALLRRNAVEHPDRPAVRMDDVEWTHLDLLERAQRWAGLLQRLRPAGAPFHVGILSDNSPDYVALLGACALTGATLVGLNNTRRGEHLARDIAHADVGILLADDTNAALLEGLDLGLQADRVVAGTPDLGAETPFEPDRDPPLEAVWCLVFTSGTSGDPKAVICSQRRMLVTGERMRQLLGVTAGDVGYVAMPLFHSNALMVGVMPALVAGATVALAPRFTASGWLADVRRYGATWFSYTGKPLSYVLSTPEGADDADNPLRRAYGNEGSPQVVAEFTRRFDVEVIDAFGPTEGGIAVTPDAGTPPGALGPAGDHIRVVDEQGNPRPPARFDPDGRLVNPDECVGEIVNTAGPGPFEGYYKNEAATQAATRRGWYWTGDLGYVDESGFLYFAGRTSDWLRVDGENFPAAPLERALQRHPDVVVAVVYGVPDVHAGDQVMAALVLDEGAGFDPAGFARWLDEQPDLGTKWRPRYLRVARELPTTGTNKVVVRRLRQEKFRLDAGSPVYVRERGADQYRRFGPDDEAALHEAFVAAGRERFWDL